MNKEFVPSEQALYMKELGFDYECLGYHNLDPYLPNPTFNLVKPFDHEWCLPAPLYQQAFRWFREKHNLQSHIEYNKGFYEWWILLNVVGYDTYEEAELACLKKLIEIAKNK
jgi:hypothetical protein